MLCVVLTPKTNLHKCTHLRCCHHSGSFLRLCSLCSPDLRPPSLSFELGAGLTNTEALCSASLERHP
jgi:hypothetical protein